MGALRQAIYIWGVGIVVSIVAYPLVALIVGPDVDRGDVLFVVLSAIVITLLPAYLVISRGWGA